jgi:hypothetical protein
MKTTIKNNSNIINIMFTVYYNLFIEFFEHLFEICYFIKEYLIKKINLENKIINYFSQTNVITLFKDCKQMILSKEPYNIIYLGLCCIYLYGLMFYNYEHYFIISTINSFILFFGLLTNFVIYTVTKYYTNEYKWISYIVIIPFTGMLINNINLLFNQKKLDGTIKASIVDTYNDLTNTYTETDTETDTDTDNKKENSGITIKEIKDLSTKKEFLSKHIVLTELDCYVKNNINIYKKILIHNLKFSTHDINNIKEIFNDKITDEELNKLIQIINKMIERKIK